MSETIMVTEEAVAENGARMKEMAQKTFYAGVGAADMAREEASTLVEKLQTRFSTAQEDAQERPASRESGCRQRVRHAVPKIALPSGTFPCHARVATRTRFG